MKQRFMAGVREFGLNLDIEQSAQTIQGKERKGQRGPEKPSLR